MDNVTILPKVKNSRTINDPLLKRTSNHSKEANKTINKTTEAISAKKELSTKLKRCRMFGYSRWGRKEDTKMFSVLRQL